MEEKDRINQIISDEDLRQRIRKVISEPEQSRVDKLSRHPITAILLGFFLTWGVGQLLTDTLKNSQIEAQKRIEQLKTKQQAGLTALGKISELMYERYSTAILLASSLKRNTDIDEIKHRKELYDESTLKWNTQIQNTQLLVRGLTSDSSFSIGESYIQFGLAPHFATIDHHLTSGYDSILQGKTWEYNSTPLRSELHNCLECSYTISNYLWVRANLYGVEKDSHELIEDAENELKHRCPHL